MTQQEIVSINTAKLPHALDEQVLLLSWRNRFVAP
jgi:hypothetical protein